MVDVLPLKSVSYPTVNLDLELEFSLNLQNSEQTCLAHPSIIFFCKIFIGDSGSPAQFGSLATSQFIQFGIVSGGLSKICGNETAPGFYTKIFDFLPWILDNSD